MSGKTEWEDALIRHKIISAPKELPDIDDIHQIAVDKILSEDKHENKTLEELDELEDDLEEDILSSYREKRISEMKAESLKEKYGNVTQISEKEFIPEVSNADSDTWVILHLFVFSKPECKLMTECLESAAKKFKSIKFLKIKSVECIHNYPDTACPTLIIYKKGDIVKQIVGLDPFGGLKMNADSLEWVLAQFGVLKTKLEENPVNKMSKNRVNLNRSAFVKSNTKSGGKKKGKDDDDDDDDDNDTEDTRTEMKKRTPIANANAQKVSRMNAYP